MKNMLMKYLRPSVKINGEVNGHICGNGLVVINRNATFFGTIKTRVLKTAGTIIGDVSSDKLIVKRTGKFYYRNVKYQSISLHSGGDCSSIKSIMEEHGENQTVAKIYITRQMEKNRDIFQEQSFDENTEGNFIELAGIEKNEKAGRFKKLSGLFRINKTQKDISVTEETVSKNYTGDKVTTVGNNSVAVENDIKYKKDIDKNFDYNEKTDIPSTKDEPLVTTFKKPTEAADRKEPLVAFAGTFTENYVNSTDKYDFRASDIKSTSEPGKKEPVINTENISYSEKEQKKTEVSRETFQEERPQKKEKSTDSGIKFVYTF